MSVQCCVGSHDASFLNGVRSGGLVVGKLDAFVIYRHVVVEKVEIV